MFSYSNSTSRTNPLIKIWGSGRSPKYTPFFELAYFLSSFLKLIFSTIAFKLFQRQKRKRKHATFFHKSNFVKFTSFFSGTTFLIKSLHHIYIWKKKTGILDEKLMYFFLDTPTVLPLWPVVLVCWPPPPLWAGGRNLLWEGGRNPLAVGGGGGGGGGG